MISSSTRFVLLRGNYATVKDSATRVYEIALAFYSMEAYKRFSKQPEKRILGVDTKLCCSFYSMKIPEGDSMATCKEGAKESLSQARRLPG